MAGLEALLRATKQRGNYSDKQITEFTGWKPKMVKDYRLITTASVALIGVIVDNEERITANEANILVNAGNISTNATNIATNVTNISTNASNFTAHNTSSTEHGVAGNNVGTLDYCTLILGGVVDLAALVADAVDSTAEVTIADVGAAPAAYNQVYTDEQTDMINDIKAKHNTLMTDLNLVVAQLNDIVSKMITAKQMSAA